MSRSDRILADAEAVLARTSDRYRSVGKRTRELHRRDLQTRLKRILIAAALVLVGAAAVGFVLPLGSTGVMIVMALLLATMAFAFIPTMRSVAPGKLEDVELKALPLQTEVWLESQRRALPAPAVKLADSIGVRLETLAPQLARLNPQEPAAVEVRRLLADHLPQLVTGYQSIPEPLRKQERNGRVPEQQLLEGLEVIDTEIGRMTEQLASGDLDKLATHNRYLELKYQEAKELGQ